MTIATLQNHSIPTNSPARAVQDFLSRELDIIKTNAFIRELIPHAPIFQPEDLQVALYTAGYLVQDIVSNKLTHMTDDTFVSANARAVALAEKSYQKAIYAGGPITRLDDDGNIINDVAQPKKVAEPKPKPSTKSGLEIAREVFAADPTLDRAAFIDILVTQHGIKSATATSYCSQVGVKPGDVKPKTKKASSGKESREDCVARVYATKMEWTSRKDLIDAIVEDCGCSRASAQTFSYKVMPSAKTK